MDDLLTGGNRISEVNETKFLGVIIDNKLNWSPHITYISKKIAFVYPYLNYCIHVWDKAYDMHVHHLIVLQNKAIRIMNCVPPRTNVDSLYVMQNILSVKRIYS